MHIAFLDPTEWNYTADTPYEQPLGGAPSAACYLAAELVKHGQHVTLFNGTPARVVARGVETRTITELGEIGMLNRFDVVVVLNKALGRKLRWDLKCDAPLVLWAQHAHDQPAMRELSRLIERKNWAGFAFVSDWQRQHFESQFGVPREKCRVMRNAVSPAFTTEPPAAPWFETGAPPLLFYASTPFRGLDVLLDAFPVIRKAVPGTRLKVFSGMSVYQVNAPDDEYRALYEKARNTEGVEYVGAVGQTKLAAGIAGAAALAYPSTFAETSCITVMEAMTCGAAVFTTRLGALPETTNGLAAMIDSQADKAKLRDSFAELTIGSLQAMRKNPAEAAAQRLARIQFVNERCTWHARAREWLEWLPQIAQSRRATMKPYAAP